MSNWRSHLQWRKLRWWLLLLVVIVIVVLAIVYRDEIVAWIQPWGLKARALPGGFLIFVFAVVIVTIPPLFGHELVGFIIGVIYFNALLVGLLIMAAGTLLGEFLLFPAFKYGFTSLKDKWDRENITYAATLRAVQRQPFLIGVLARFSLLPAHYATPVFAHAGMEWLMFILLCIVTLPYQLATVYLGYLYGQPAKKKKDEDSARTQKIIEYTTLGITIAVSVAAALFLYWRLKKTRPEILQERGLVEDADGNLVRK